MDKSIDATRFKARDQSLAWREVEGEIVVLHLETSDYLTLNPTGAVLWHALSERPVTRAQLVQRLCEEFEVDAGTAGADVDEFLDSCEEHRLVEQIK